jgi:hypothetical protein
MAGFQKLWLGTTGDYGLSTNWQAVSIRNAAYSWTASGGGTNEYYLRTAANGNPGFAATPALVYINGASASSGTAGSLAAGTWAYADNDTLGYSTIYVRLSDGTDPDSKAADYVTFYQIPKTDDDVVFRVGSGSTVSSNLDNAAVAIDDFVTEAEWSGTIGSATNFLRIDPNRFEWNGGSGYIDLGATAIPLRVTKTATPSYGYRALYLRGTALTTVDLAGGSVGLAVNAGDSLTCTTLRVTGADVIAGAGCTLTTVDVLNGQLLLRTNATTLNVYGGQVTLDAACAVTTINLYGGEVKYGSTGNITTLNHNGGTFDERVSGATRTITTYNANGGQLKRYKEAVTHTTLAFGRSLVISMS